MDSVRSIFCCVLFATGCPASSEDAQASDSDGQCVDGTHLCPCLGGATCDADLLCEGGYCVQAASEGGSSDHGGSNGPSATATGAGSSASSDSSGPDDGSSSSGGVATTGTTPPQGTCEPGAVCAVDSTGNMVGDRCIFTCNTPMDCPLAPTLQCYLCQNTVIGDVCVPDENSPDIFACNSQFGGQGLVDWSLCLPSECEPTADCIVLDPMPMVTTPGYCAPGCTP